MLIGGIPLHFGGHCCQLTAFCPVLWAKSVVNLQCERIFQPCLAVEWQDATTTAKFMHQEES